MLRFAFGAKSSAYSAHRKIRCIILASDRFLTDLIAELRAGYAINLSRKASVLHQQVLTLYSRGNFCLIVKNVRGRSVAAFQMKAGLL